MHGATFSPDLISFEDARDSQSDGGGVFTLNLFANVQVSLMMMIT
jgi:hypothetical protein